MRRAGALVAVAVLVCGGCGGGRTEPPRARVAAPDSAATVSDSVGWVSRPATAGVAPDRQAGDSGDVTGAGENGASPSLPEPVLRADHLIAGYRVQVLASAWLTEAEKLRDRLRSQGLPAYVEYRSPLYRVRIGDCTDLAEARVLRERAVLLGFDRATIVPTLVQSQEKDRVPERTP